MKRLLTVKFLAAIVVLVLNAICHITVIMGDIDSTNLKIIGSYISIAIISLVTWCFSLKFYLSSLAFGFFASSLGSCLNLYWRVGFYDVFIHYLSGIILGWAGLIIISKIFNRNNFPDLFWLKNTYSFLFSCSCAGFWEIYEFTVDCIINAHMQGDNFNTMGDMVAGVLGAASYFIISSIFNRRKRFHKLAN